MSTYQDNAKNYTTDANTGLKVKEQKFPRYWAKIQPHRYGSQKIITKSRDPSKLTLLVVHVSDFVIWYTYNIHTRKGY